MSDDAALCEAIRLAHAAAECGDFYCGCWDPDPTSIFGRDAEPDHSRRFVEALAAQGYEVRLLNQKPRHNPDDQRDGEHGS